MGDSLVPAFRSSSMVVGIVPGDGEIALRWRWYDIGHWELLEIARLNRGSTIHTAIPQSFVFRDTMVFIYYHCLKPPQGNTGL